MLIEYPDVEERHLMLGLLKGIEDRIWLRVEDCEPVYAIADEDLERENEEKTSAVHFLRFELTPEMKNRLQQGAALAFGVDHANYAADIPAVPESLRLSLLADLA
ncbi:MAG: DUF3501 family protein [Candidatus Competibacteraceae bacterium]